MSITSQSDCTPVTNQFREKVLRGLDELQKQVTAAGGVGEYISGQIGWTQECDRVWVNVVWNGETIKVTEEQYFFEPPSSGWIVLANWDSWDYMYAAHLVAPFGGISLVDQDKLRSRWLEELYPQSMTNDSHLVEQLASGGIPLDIEFEELGINLEALEDICNSAYLALAPSDETHVNAAVALLTYYEDREDSGRVDPLDGPTIFHWLTERGVSGELTSILTHPRRSA